MSADSVVPNDNAETDLFTWFARSVERVPDAPALECSGSEVSYARLAASVERLSESVESAAGRVRAVGLLANRDLVAYVGYLAVQRLGAVVVPLNPAWPAERIALVSELAGLDLVIASGAVARQMSVPVLQVHSADVLADSGTSTGRRSAASPDDVAYLLFTSGSTGTPKGVPIRHRNISSYLSHVIPRYGFGPGDRVSQTFDLTFDLSVFDLFAAWGSGATLVVPGRAELMNPAAFVAKRRITHWFSVPSVVSVASRLGLLAPDSMPDLRWSLFCGEQLTVDQARRWRLAAPGSALENLYGPTELTLSCTQFRLPEDLSQLPPTANGTVPIGTVYPGHEFVVLDESGGQADVGELCVRGPQRFDGYLDATADAGRFVRFDGDRAVVLTAADRPRRTDWYRTGDVVRLVGEDLLHLGRLDDQVKVQGHRVELGEVEAALRAQPGVTEAVVALVDEGRGTRVLKAACTGVAIEPKDLLRALRDRLPRYMVPESVTVVAELPLNTNGKLDRKRISADLGDRRPPR